MTACWITVETAVSWAPAIAACFTLASVIYVSWKNNLTLTEKIESDRVMAKYVSDRTEIIEKALHAESTRVNIIADEVALLAKERDERRGSPEDK